MNDERSFERTAQAWLELGANQAPDRTVQEVLLAIETTPQERDLGIPWRFPTMNTPVRVGMAAVIGLLLLGAGIYLFGGGGPGLGGQPAATPTPTPTAATPTSSPAASPVNLTPGTLCTGDTCRSGSLDPGTYAFEPGKVTSVQFSFTVPAGWAIDTEGFVKKYPGTAEEVYMTAWSVSHIYGDACHRTGTLVAAGTTAEDLTAALAVQKGRVASPVTDVTVGGLPAKRITLTVPADTDVTTCEAGVVRVWPDPGPDESGGLCCSAAGSTDVVTSVDVAGQRMVVIARHESGSSSADQAELQAIVDSITFEPPAAGSPAGRVSPSP